MTILLIDMFNMNHQMKYTTPMYYMFEEFRIENNLPELYAPGSIGLCNIPVKDFLNQLSKWAINKYNMKVLPLYKNDKAVRYLAIGFDNMTLSEVDEVFVSLFPEPEI